MQNTLLLLRRHRALLALLILTFVVYLPSLNGSFVVDDVPTIQNNPYLLDASHLGQFFTKGVWASSALQNDSVPIYRPMYLLVEWVNHHLWGDKPFGYHLVSMLLHVLNVALVYVLIRKLSAASGLAAAIGAALFALHPARVESVAWMSGITDPLVACFLMLGVLAHRAYLERGMAVSYLALTAVCLQLALWNKEVAVAFPVLVLVHDWLTRKKIHWASLAVYAAVVLAYLVARGAALVAASKPTLDFSHLPRAWDFILGYSEMLTFPLQVPFYLQPPEHAVGGALGMFGLLIVCAVTAYTGRVCGSGQRAAFWFGAAWIVLLSWPAILLALFQDGYYSARFLYLPAIGFAWLAALLFAHLETRLPKLKPALIGASGLLLALYAGLSWQEISSWHDEGAIYGKIARVAPESSSGFIGLGHFYLDKDNPTEAEKNFLLGLGKAKNDAARIEALLALGMINGMKNQLSQSANYFSAVTKIDVKNSEAWAGLGNVAWAMGDLPRAIAHYEQALAARGNNYEAAMNLASCYDKTGQPERAASLRQRAMGMRR